jgi:dTDP-4-dehydrorhamnose reductase
MGQVAVTGAAGQLGRQLVNAFEAAGDHVIRLSRPLLDLDDPGAAIDALARVQPQVIVHAAAWTDVDGCARQPELALRRNAIASERLAGGSAAWQPLFVQVSTNEVFDGTADHPYVETDAPKAINPYGASKLAAEFAVAEATQHHLIVRTAWLFGPDGSNFVTKIATAADRASAEGKPLRVVDDEWGNPTWTPALAEAIRLAVERAPEAGIRTLHLAGTPATSRHGWAAQISASLDEPPGLEAISATEYRRASAVPRHAVLSTDRARWLGIAALGWMDETADYVRSMLRRQL